MSKKYFVFDNGERVSPAVKKKIREDEETHRRESDIKKIEKASEAIKKQYNLKHVEGRIIAKVDILQKNGYTFSNGTTIRLERGFDNFDRKYTEQVMGVVIDAENIPKESLILFHHNSLHETYEVFNHSQLGVEEIESGVKIFSIMERDCFFWKGLNDEDWNPTVGYETALRVFQPYKGMIQGISHTQLKDTLYVTSGNFKGQVVKTVKSADYEITFRDPVTGRDNKIIRFRPNGNEAEEREPEAIAIMNELTHLVELGKVYVGLTTSDAKPVFEYLNYPVNMYGE